MTETEVPQQPQGDEEPEQSTELVEEGAPIWMTTFGDLMSLLLTFFVLLYSMSELKQDKFLQASQSLRDAMGGSAEVVPENPEGLIDDEMDPTKFLADPTGGSTGDPVLDAVADAYMEVIAKRLDQFIEENSLEASFSVERAADGIYLRMQSSALFSSGSGSLQLSAVPMLEYLGQITSTIDVKSVVSGHADNQPIQTAQFASNWELSAARAAGVARHLVEYGQDPEMVRVESFGEYKPVAPNETPDGRALNRRVEVFFARADIIDAVRRWALTGEQVPEFADAGDIGGASPSEAATVVPDFATVEGG